MWTAMFEHLLRMGCRKLRRTPGFSMLQLRSGVFVSERALRRSTFSSVSTRWVALTSWLTLSTQLAHQATVLSIRAAREHMKIGIKESEARQLVVSALTAAGLKDAFALTLFGGGYCWVYDYSDHLPSMQRLPLYHMAPEPMPLLANMSLFSLIREDLSMGIAATSQGQVLMLHDQLRNVSAESNRS